MLLPENTPYVSSEISLFEKLVAAGEDKSHITLPLQLHGFLVACLNDHLRDTRILSHVLAANFLRSAEVRGRRANVLLKRTGDEALLLAGLFPERALRLHVSSTYFRHMGQIAYESLAARLESTGMRELGKFYDNVAENFGCLEKVLNGARARPDDAWEAWRRMLATLQ